ncbi:hypothetical protein D3OALGA1CA_2572 [Olavius algarvensis associated proteobacterium Delta 3]|nr:hypothetical protein D3OALGA1CA_2572 [Olavius algarvensis associated proteobacterium Delta 3]CAB5146222.1 hypothetical protein D3OALGB2SA_4522 [Olavius algarvensis associated proteobacterium Delta 3]
MLTKVLIKRQFKKGNEKEIIALLTDLRYRAMKQAGYLSGITLTDPENPYSMLVIGTWQNMDSWILWKNDPERQNFEAMLDIYQEEPTEYDAYIVGAPFVGNDGN